MPKSRYDMGGYNAPRKKRGRYKKMNPIEPRGQQKKEYVFQKSFWRKHKMDQIIQLTEKELDILIDKYFEEYEERQLAANPTWNYPDIIRVKDMRPVDNKHKK